MLKQSYTTKDLLIAIFAIAFALPFWMMSKQYPEWQLAFWCIVSVFSIGVAVGALTTTRPLLVGLIMAGVFASMGTFLLLAAALVKWIFHT